MSSTTQPPRIVTHYLPPQTISNWAIMAFSALTMLAFSRRSNFHPMPSSPIHSLKADHPSIFKVCSNYQPWVFGLAVGIHLVEVWVFHWIKLRKFGVTMGSGVWWMWMVSCFVEGLPAFARIEAAAKVKKS